MEQKYLKYKMKYLNNKMNGGMKGLSPEDMKEYNDSDSDSIAHENYFINKIGRNLTVNKSDYDNLLQHYSNLRELKDKKNKEIEELKEKFKTADYSSDGRSMMRIIMLIMILKIALH